jgi:hypothetical protein
MEAPHDGLNMTILSILNKSFSIQEVFRTDFYLTLRRAKQLVYVFRSIQTLSLTLYCLAKVWFKRLYLSISLVSKFEAIQIC